MDAVAQCGALTHEVAALPQDLFAQACLLAGDVEAADEARTQQ